MSRTIRTLVPNNYWATSTDKREIAKYTADHDSGWYTLPKFFRKIVNHSRRSRDRRELAKALTKHDYVPNMSPWSCKDSNEWGYF